MSFQDIERGSTVAVAAATGGPKSGVSAGIFQLNTAVAGFRRLVDAVGTVKDTPDHRRALQNARKRIGELAKETSEKLKALSDANRGGDLSKKKEESKLAKDLQAVLQEFQKIQKLAAEQEAAYAPNPSSSSSSATHERSVAEERQQEEQDEDDRTHPWGQKRQEVLTLDNEIASNDVVIEERDQGIREINYDVEQVNEIYKDLAILLLDQQATIDSIDKHVEAAYVSNASAKTQVRTASESSKSRWCFWALIIFVMVLVILLLVLIVL
ncbi:syntaxin-22-like isoform X1 [Ananas comosus]|uniref:Syntaxin-22-like isoform X1 n=1 Tax=Ananas comosus TaxID=4615 RepID=A0A6P5EWG0_ANACO|nr:syntaxin-22-like isoform X1 [Ananas comosus]XP_020087915.1 syntaxin-22-like isoform X1 [Ananas comosus]